MHKREAGGYRFLTGASPFSAGVAVEPGFGLVRGRFATPPAMADGFRRIDAALAAAGRPPAALCAVELRSPAPVGLDAFKDFNRAYLALLDARGLLVDGRSPLARTNVCPEAGAPTSPSIHAFCFSVPGPGPGFAISGVAEVPDGRGSYPDRIVRRGERSADALREKARFVVAELERRMAALGVSWKDATETQVYTVHEVELGLPASRMIARPPLLELDFEMDVHGIVREHVLY